MDRLISEKAVIDRLSHWYSDMLETGKEKEDLIEVIKTIPSAEPYKGMTNGEVIKAMFPDIPRTLEWHIQNVTDNDWWNSPYQKGGKE